MSRIAQAPVHRRSRRALPLSAVVVLSALVGAAALLPGAAGGRAPATVRADSLRILHPVPFECRPGMAPCMRVANEFLRADVNPLGALSVGTTGGDPDTSLDDDKGMLYGFVPGGASNTGSSYVSVRIIGPSGTDDFFAASTDDVAAQTEDAATVRTEWLRRTPHRVRITQILALKPNPYSGRSDVLDMEWDVKNEDNVPLDVGIRSLLDVQIAGNDGAPYFIPGVGTVTLERRFSGADVPPFWIAFEAKDFDPSRLRGLGLLRGPGVTTPDDLVLANWRKIQETPFDYAVDATRVITADSAVALYWRPRTVAPGAGFRVNTSYGIAANQGGRAFITAPVEAECGTTFAAALFVTNFDLAPLKAGLATVTLPAGLTLAPGETAQRALGEIGPGETKSVVWQVRAGAGAIGSRTVHTAAVFEGGRTFDAQVDLDVRCAAPPSATATTAATAPPPPSPTPSRDSPGVCDWLLGRVPRVAIDAALAEPDRVYGWNLPQNPNRPVSPYNPMRRWLSLSNRGVPYTPISNPLIFKAGCP